MSDLSNPRKYDPCKYGIVHGLNPCVQCERDQLRADRESWRDAHKKVCDVRDELQSKLATVEKERDNIQVSYEGVCKLQDLQEKVMQKTQGVIFDLKEKLAPSSEDWIEKKSQAIFVKELEDLINRYSLENGSNTPDFILAEYLANSLAVFNRAVQQRETWYGRRDVRPSTMISHPAKEAEKGEGG